MRLILLLSILSTPAFALVEGDHSLTSEPCPVKALSIQNAEKEAEEIEE